MSAYPGEARVSAALPAGTPPADKHPPPGEGCLSPGQVTGPGASKLASTVEAAGEVSLPDWGARKFFGPVCPSGPFPFVVVVMAPPTRAATR